MKLVRYSKQGGAARVGVLEDGSQGYIRPLEAGGMVELISSSGGGLDNAEEAGESVGVEEVRLLAPLQNPQKVIGIGLNYSDHAAETGAQIPEKPIVFAKYPNTLAGPGDTIKIPRITEQADYEVELAVVIGREAKGVSEEAALEYVFGYMSANDVSSRDLQFSEGGQWTRSKSIDTFCPIGPYLVSADEVGDPQELKLRCVLNGEVMQEGETSKMIFSVAQLVSFLRGGMTLLPGDIILTGTPPGVGAAREPQVFLKGGDEVSVEVEGLGELVNPVEAG